MKKIYAIFAIITLSLVMLAGCSGSGEGSSAGSDNADDAGGESLSIVTTTFPVYDWTINVAGDAEGVNVDMLIDSGVDLHSFQPTTEDIRKIAESDVFIYVGGESDEWVEDALKEVSADKTTAINLMELLGDKAKEEEEKEGMQEDAEHEHEHADEEAGHDDEAEHEHEGEAPEYDEHIWLSLKNAGSLVSGIATALAEKDADNASLYESNAAAYAAELSSLNKAYEDAIGPAAVKTLLFGDRFPFRYMTDDYGLDYYAAFAGCSAETEASFETIAFLAGKLDELGLRHVMTIEGSDHRIAESIISSSKSGSADILTLNSMQSVTAQDAESGTTYLSIMKDNLEVLKKALS